MSKPTKERRKQTRARGATGLTVGVEPKGPAIQVRDISVSGVSFRTEDPVEFMTRLMLTLVFPEPAGPQEIQVEGAVVRCDIIQVNGGSQYEVAVFFTQIDETAIKAIDDYVKAH